MLDITYSAHGRRRPKSLKYIVFDSAIIALIAFVSALPQQRLPSLNDLYTALYAFLYAFAIQLAVERGLKTYKP